MTLWNMSGVAPGPLGRATTAALLGMLVMGVTLATTVTSTNLGTSPIGLAKEAFSDDPDVVVTSKRVINQSGTVAAAGDSAPGVEVADTLPVVTNGKGVEAPQDAYEFVVKESGNNTLTDAPPENLKIEVFMDDGTSNDLIATLYTKQDAAQTTAIEGVTVRAFTGLTNAAGNVFSIVITRQ